MRFKIRKIAFLFLALTVMASTSVYAIEEIKIEKDSIVNLKDCIKIALENSPLIKKYKYNYGVSKSNVGIAKSAYFPTIGVGTGYTVNSSTSSGRSMYNSYNCSDVVDGRSIYDVVSDYDWTYETMLMMARERVSVDAGNYGLVLQNAPMADSFFYGAGFMFLKNTDAPDCGMSHPDCRDPQPMTGSTPRSSHSSSLSRTDPSYSGTHSPMSETGPR